MLAVNDIYFEIVIWWLGSGLVESLGQIVFIREKKVSNTNLLASRHRKREKASLPVDAQKRLCLKSLLSSSSTSLSSVIIKKIVYLSLLVIRCPSLPIPDNGVKTGCRDPLSERYGTICSFSCNVGYNLTGSSRRQCLENKTWSGTTSSCQGEETLSLEGLPNKMREKKTNLVP